MVTLIGAIGDLTGAGNTVTPSPARRLQPRRVRGRSRRRLPVAALTCDKPGGRPRLIYRPAPDRRADGRKSFDWRDYRDLLISAHTQLDGPLVMIWDNLNTHRARSMREFVDSHDWLVVFQLPPYCPHLNSVEGICHCSGASSPTPRSPTPTI